MGMYKKNMRAKECIVVMEVPGKRRRRRRRPMRRWLDNIRNDLSERELPGGAQEAPHKKHRPHIKVGKDAAEEEVIVYPFQIM